MSSALTGVFVRPVKDYRAQATSHVTFLLLVGQVGVDCFKSSSEHNKEPSDTKPVQSVPSFVFACKDDRSVTTMVTNGKNPPMGRVSAANILRSRSYLVVFIFTFTRALNRTNSSCVDPLIISISGTEAPSVEGNGIRFLKYEGPRAPRLLGNTGQLGTATLASPHSPFKTYDLCGIGHPASPPFFDFKVPQAQITYIASMSTTSPHISNGVSGVTSHRVGRSLVDVIRIIAAGVALRYYFTSRSRGLLQQSYALLPQEEYKCASKDVLKIAKVTLCR
ncbi:hypothetical protein EDB89DRAFT_1629506 [Lactarius sanguifluus]|nr:hypothetical protein EDB89DRAFT_1629506 [Lactarius sanguifluus]